MFAADRGSGASGDRGEAVVSGEVTGGGEAFAGDFGEESGCGPDPDSGHAGQDGVKRVCLHEFLDLDSDVRALPAQRGQLFGQAWQDGTGGVGADYDDGLL